MKEKVTLLEYVFGTVFHEDGVEEDACYIYAARAYGKKTRLLGSRGEEMVREGGEELLGCAERDGGRRNEVRLESAMKYRTLLKKALKGLNGKSKGGKEMMWIVEWNIKEKDFEIYEVHPLYKVGKVWFDYDTVCVVVEAENADEARDKAVGVIVKWREEDTADMVMENERLIAEKKSARLTCE